VWQHTLGVVGNSTHCFVGNLTDFLAVKELRKLVTVLTLEEGGALFETV